MRFAAAALQRARRARRTASALSLERNMKCAHRPLRALPARPAVRLQGRAGLPLRRASSRCCGCASCERRAPDARRVEVRLLRRLPAHAARLRGRAARARRRARDRLLPGGRAARRSTGPTTSRSSRARSPPPHDAERIREVRAQSRRLGHDRRLRHGGRHPGAAQLRRRRRLHVASSTPRPSTSPRSRPRRRSPTTCTSTSSCSGCPIDKRQLLEVISAFLNERRPRDRRAQRLRRVQARAATSA